jgi:hypothetical protein
MPLPQNRPVTQVEIETEIIRLSALLEEETERYAVLIEDHAKKEARHKKEWAKSYLAADGAVKERESWAEYKTADGLFEMKVAEALAKAKKEKLTSLRTSLDSLRTLAANLRVQV